MSLFRTLYWGNHALWVHVCLKENIRWNGDTWKVEMFQHGTCIRRRNELLWASQFQGSVDQIVITWNSPTCTGRNKDPNTASNGSKQNLGTKYLGLCSLDRERWECVCNNAKAMVLWSNAMWLSTRDCLHVVQTHHTVHTSATWQGSFRVISSAF